MEIQALRDLVGRIAGKENISVIAPALERFEIETDQSLTEATATIATHQAIDYMERAPGLFNVRDYPLSTRRQFISDYLQGRSK